MLDTERKLVAVTAPTCAGKTTLLAELNRRLGNEFAVYPYDEHDMFPSGSAQLKELLRLGGIPHWEDPRLFDNAAFIQNLRDLKRGRPAILPSNSRESMGHDRTTRLLHPGRITAAEGIFTCHYADARRLYNTRIFIHLPEDEMVKRRLARTPKDSPDPWDQEEYIKGPMVVATRKYVYRQMRYADLTLDGMDTINSLADQVMDKLGIR